MKTMIGSTVIDMAKARRDGYVYVVSIACPHCKTPNASLLFSREDELVAACPHCGCRVMGMVREFNTILDREMNSLESIMDSSDETSLKYRQANGRWQAISGVTFK